MQAVQNSSAAGYYDTRGNWVPVSAEGYYDANGRWIAAAAPGYYDRSGRWIAGPTTGRYDDYGRWIQGQAAGRMINGAWVADPQPGYYENGRWVRGAALGYYDARGRWISTSGALSRTAYPVTADAAERRSLEDRIAWLDRRIRRGINDGSLNRLEANQALRSLDGIRRDEEELAGRVDGLTEQLRMDRSD